jgi:hypothetical protein
MKRLLILAPAALLTLAACSGDGYRSGTPTPTYGGTNYTTPNADIPSTNAGGPGTNNAPINPSATSSGGGD